MEALDLISTAQTAQRFVLGSQQEAYAFSSLVVASLPFPPLPVLVLQGEDGEYGMASSFELLQHAIAVQQTGCVPSGDLMHNKREALEALRRDMVAHYERGVACTASASCCGNGASLCSDYWVQGAYDIYCAAFRKYLLHNYATCSHDLRFHPLDSVPADSVLVHQGTSHWKAGRVLAGEQEQSGDFDAAFTSYAQMLRSYAVDLATLPAF